MKPLNKKGPVVVPFINFMFVFLSLSISICFSLCLSIPPTLSLPTISISISLSLFQSPNQTSHMPTAGLHIQHLKLRNFSVVSGRN